MILKLNVSIFKKEVTIPLIALTCLLYSCSGTETADNKLENTPATQKETTGNTPADACSLITEEEAKAVLGSAVKKAVGTAIMCQYVDASDKISESGNVSIQLNYGEGSGYDNYIINSEKGFDVKAKTVTGVGDKAFFVAGQLIVLTGPHFITVIVGKNSSEEQVIAAEKTIAQKAIERLEAK